VPLAVFIVVAIAGFRADVFALNFWGSDAHDLSSVASQVRNTMLVTVFVFVGIEGASAWVDALVACYRREKNAKNTKGTQKA